MDILAEMIGTALLPIYHWIERHFETFPLGLALASLLLAASCAVFGKWGWAALILATSLGVVWIAWQMAHDSRHQ